MLKEKLHMNYFMPKKLFLFVVALLFGVLFSLSSITSVQAINDKTKNLKYDTNGYIEGDIVYTDKEDGGGEEPAVIIEASFDFAHTDDSFESLNLRVSEDLPSYQEEGYVVGNNEGDESQFLFAALQLECVNIAEDGQSAFIAGQAFDMEDRNPTGQDGKWFVAQLHDDGINDTIDLLNPAWYDDGEYVTNVCSGEGEIDPSELVWETYPAMAFDENGVQVSAIDIYPPENGGGGEATPASITETSFVTTNLFDTSDEDGNFQLFYLNNITEEVDNPEVMMVFDYQSTVFENGAQNPGPISHFDLSCVNISEDGSSAFIAGTVEDSDDPTLVDESFVVKLVDGDIEGISDGIYWSTPTWGQSEADVLGICQAGTANPVTEEWNYSDAQAWDFAAQAVAEGADAIDILPANSGSDGEEPVEEPGEEPGFEYYQRIVVNGDNENGGTLHWENPYDDWGNVNPEEVGLDSETTPEEMEAYGAELWYDMELSCVNVIGGYQGAFAAGQIVDGGQIVAEEGLLETWHVFQFLDNGTGPDDMFYSYETQEMDLTEEQAVSYCLSGSLNVEEEWQLGAPNTILEGDISITTPTLVDRVYQLGEELALVADRGELDIGCTDVNYTLVDGEFSKYYKEIYTPNREAFESGKPGAKMTISILNEYDGVWAHGNWGELEEGSALFELANSTALTAKIVIGTDGSEKVDFSWSGEFVNQDTGETEDWFNGDFKIKNGQLQNGTVEGTCSLM